MTKKATETKKATKVVDVTAAPLPPEIADLPPPPPVDEVLFGKKKTETCYEFVKNYKLKELIEFGPGDTFVFPCNPFHTSDKVLVEKLRGVAHLYKIVENPSTEV